MPREALLEDGYAHYVIRPGRASLDKEIELLRSEFAKLELDPYAPSGANRYRRYGNGVILPWCDKATPHWIPALKGSGGQRLAAYGQGSFNPDHQCSRQFPCLSEDVMECALLLDLIREDYSNTFWASSGQALPLYFGVHFIKLTSCGPDDWGVSSPNCFHQDGETFTFAHLIHRSHNMGGGINYIAAPELRDTALEDVRPDQIISEFTLVNPLDSFVVHDPRVSHYVSPVRMASDGDFDAMVCERCMVLVDFSPTVQKI